MVAGDEDPFVLTPFESYISKTHCGYCSLGPKPLPLGDTPLPENAGGSKNVNYCIGSQVIAMTCEDYEKCMNMGYRRSGNFLYRCDMLRGCCRMYTSRTNLGMMKISKEHRQVINRFKKAIDDENMLLPFNVLKGESKGKNSKKDFDLTSLIEAEQKSHRFWTSFGPADYTDEKYELYQKYQSIVHKEKPEEITRSGFARFLCLNPFYSNVNDPDDEELEKLEDWVSNWKRGTKLPRTRRLGPTHECYYLDGKLIAISVIDFLPNSLSSVYFIWNPDYAHLSLGTLLSLREIQMCHELGIQYYYLGYFISDCAKMRYKGKFGGELLDLCTHVFAPFDKVLPLIENNRLWTLGDIDGTTDGMLEPYLELTGRPGVYSKEIVNKAQTIYGNKAVYERAQETLDLFSKKIEVGQMEVPPVFPGSLPLSLALPVFQLNMGVEVDVFIRRQQKRKFNELNAEQRLIIVDTARMLGFELLLSRLVVALPE